ncbi:hypothetical protein ES703_37451 [subsurface metagenome]
MALSDEQCQLCQDDLEKMKALPAELRWLPEAQDRVAALENALERECSTGVPGFGAALVGIGVLTVGALALAALASADSGGE